MDQNITCRHPLHTPDDDATMNSSPNRTTTTWITNNCSDISKGATNTDRRVPEVQTTVHSRNTSQIHHFRSVWPSAAHHRIESKSHKLRLLISPLSSPAFPAVLRTFKTIKPSLARIVVQLISRCELSLSTADSAVHPLPVSPIQTTSSPSYSKSYTDYPLTPCPHLIASRN